MSSCCCPEKPGKPSAASRCPRSGSAGKAVDRLTVKALLTEHALGRLTSSEYRFCLDSDCDVVYFGADGAQYETRDLRVGVWQKLAFGDRRVCYCFGESEASMRAEIAASGRSFAAERVREHIAAGRCACEVRNPRGTCCLGELIAAVKRVESALETASHANLNAAAAAQNTDGR
jgi:hypothetical protein